MGEETAYEYDPSTGSGQAGRLWKVTDAKNQITEYGYDAQSRIETIAYADGNTVTLSYDVDGNIAGYSDGTTSATYTYDDMGRKLTETVNYGPFSKSFAYSYYGNGLKQTFSAPDSTVYTYLYGLNNELQEIQIPGVGSITIPTYIWNRPATVNFPGGTQRSYGYDALMRLQSLSVTDPSSNPLLNYQYSYDEIGNILTKTTEHGNYSYGYDDVSRLLTADNPVLDDEAYTYDNVGNRLTDSSVSGSWSYNLNNELLGYADVEYEYDANGNMTQKRVGTAAVNYIYDAANRLVKVEDDATQTVIAEYSYDPFGRRLWKEVGGVRTYFFYSEEGLIAEYDVSGTEIRSYGYKPDSTWTTDPLWLKEGGTYYWYQNDHLGTPQKLTAQDGTVVWSAQYTAFGEATIDVNTVENPLRLPGQYADAETGLLYNWFRYYDPKIGRYIQEDPIDLLGGNPNLYVYAWTDPVNNRDPYGLADLLTESAKQIARRKAQRRLAGEVVKNIGRLGKLGRYAGWIAFVIGQLIYAPKANEEDEEEWIEQYFQQHPELFEPSLPHNDFPYPHPHPQPNPVLKKTDKRTDDDCCIDDAGKKCEKCGAIIVYAVRPGKREDTPVGHAFVGYRLEFGVSGLVIENAYGWTIAQKPVPITQVVPGMVVNNRLLVRDAKILREYRACPGSIGDVLDYMKEEGARNNYQIENVGGVNCFGWAFEFVKEGGGFVPPREPNIIFGPFKTNPEQTWAYIEEFAQFVNVLIDEIIRERL